MSHKGFVNLAINQFSSHGAHHQLILMTVAAQAALTLLKDKPTIL